MGPPGQKPVLCSMSYVQMLYTQKGESIRMKKNPAMPLLGSMGMASIMGPFIKTVFDKVAAKNDVWVTIRHDRYNELMTKEAKLLKLEKKRHNRRGKQ